MTDNTQGMDLPSPRGRLRAMVVCLTILPVACGLFEDRPLGVVVQRPSAADAGTTGADAGIQHIGRVRGFLGDAPRDDYTEISVVVHRVDVVGADGGTATLLDSPQGLEQNLVELRTEGGELRYTSLGPPAPSMAPTSMVVELAPQVRLIGRQRGDVEHRLIDPLVPRTAEGRARIVVPMPGRAALGDGDVVLDFDLDSFLFSGAFVTPVVRESLVTAVPDDAVIGFAIEGFARGFVSPTQRFKIEDLSGTMRGVRLLEGDRITSDIAGSLATIPADAPVRAFGARTSGATDITLEFVTVHESDPLTVRGVVDQLDLRSRMVHVVADSGSPTEVFIDLSRSVRCVDVNGAFLPCLAALAVATPGTLVEGSGYYVPAASRVDALFFRLVPPQEVSVLGHVADASVTTNYRLDQLSNHRNIEPTVTELDIAITPTTQFVSAAGAPLVSGTDAAALTRGAVVRVTGIRSGTTLTAITVRYQ